MAKQFQLAPKEKMLVLAPTGIVELELLSASPTADVVDLRIQGAPKTGVAPIRTLCDRRTERSDNFSIRKSESEFVRPDTFNPASYAIASVSASGVLDLNVSFKYTGAVKVSDTLSQFRFEVKIADVADDDIHITIPSHAIRNELKSAAGPIKNIPTDRFKAVPPPPPRVVETQQTQSRPGNRRHMELKLINHDSITLDNKVTKIKITLAQTESSPLRFLIGRVLPDGSSTDAVVTVEVSQGKTLASWGMPNASFKAWPTPESKKYDCGINLQYPTDTHLERVPKAG